MKPVSSEVAELYVWCPRCHKKTDRIQAFDAPLGLFLLVYIVHTTEKIVGCPQCVRARLWKRFWWNIPMMNVLCWLFGSWIALQLLVSHLRDRPGVPPEYQHWTEPPIVKPPPERWQGTSAGQGKRLLLVLFLLVVVVVFVFLVLPNLLTR